MSFSPNGKCIKQPYWIGRWSFLWQQNSFSLVLKWTNQHQFDYYSLKFEQRLLRRIIKEHFGGSAACCFWPHRGLQVHQIGLRTKWLERRLDCLLEWPSQQVNHRTPSKYNAQWAAEQWVSGSNGWSFHPKKKKEVITSSQSITHKATCG